MQVGNIVTLDIDLIKDKDLLDFMEEFSSDFKVIVTCIEKDKFWGYTTSHVQVPTHMETKYVEDVENTNINLNYSVWKVKRCSVCGEYKFEEELSDVHGFINICDNCAREIESRGLT